MPLNPEAHPLLAHPSCDSSHQPFHSPPPQFWLTQLALAIWFFSILFIVLSNQDGLFSFHPICQAIATCLFFQGILTLQPTRTEPQKIAGLLRHQLIQSLALISILAGLIVIFIVKISHAAIHYTTWHAKLGLATVILIVFQALFGAFIGLRVSRGRLISEPKARSLWKYHRFSGYVIMILLTLTVLTVTKSDWLTGVASSVSLWILKVTPLAFIIGLFSLIRVQKIVPSWTSSN